MTVHKVIQPANAWTRQVHPSHMLFFQVARATGTGWGKGDPCVSVVLVSIPSLASLQEIPNHSCTRAMPVSQ